MISGQYCDERAPSTVCCLLFRASRVPFVQPSVLPDSSRSLRPPRGPGRLPRAKTTCLSIFPVALLRVIKVSPFSLSLFSLPHPHLLSFPFSHSILPSSSIWRSLLFFLPLSLTVFLLNDRPFTAVSDDIAGARRFPRESRDSFTLTPSFSRFSSSHRFELSAIGFPLHRYRLR